MRITSKQLAAMTGRKVAKPAGAVGLGRRRARTEGMNKLEAAYAARLDQMPSVVWWAFEAVKFRLAANTFYTPDFIVMLYDATIEVHEVKGFWEDDARVKIKVAAAMFPFRFLAVTRRKGEWNTEVIGSAAAVEAAVRGDA